MQAVIMAGGKGTRLHALTRDEIPKPMIPVEGKPLLERQIEALRGSGVDDIILVVGHLSERIAAHFGDGGAWGVRLRYVVEQQPLGTAGAFALLRGMLDGRFLLVFGDVLFDIDVPRMCAFAQERHADALLFVHPNAHPQDSDLVQMDADGRITGFLHKNRSREGDQENCVNAGIYCLSPAVLARVPSPTRTDLEQDVLAPMIAGGRVYGYRSPEYVKDLGTPDRLQKGEEDVRRGIVAQRNLRNPQRCVFLDRDGTINVQRGLIAAPDDIMLEQRAAEAIRLLNASRYLAIIITNQPVIARGLCTPEQLAAIHRRLSMRLGETGAYVDDLRYCPHHPDKGYPEENAAYKIACACRKPGTAMFEQCAQQYHIDMSRSWMVGDTTTDIRAGRSAGLHTALVRTGAGGTDGKYAVCPDATYDDLYDAVCAVLAQD